MRLPTKEELEALRLKREDVYFQWKKLDDYIVSIQRKTHLKSSKLEKLIPHIYRQRYQLKRELNKLNTRITLKGLLLNAIRGNT